MRKLLSRVFSRMGFTMIFMALQVLLLVVMIAAFRERYAVFQLFCSLASVLIVVYLVNKPENTAYKLAWILPILALPIFGGLLYLVFGRNRLTDRQKSGIAGAHSQYARVMAECPSALEQLREISPDAAFQAAYLQKSTGSPLFRETDCEYFHLGDDMIPRLLEALRDAKKFIFMEYFIIDPGRVWDQVLEILEEKARQGLDVRIIYDDFGCMFKLPEGYNRVLEEKGIRCCIFHRFVPVLTGSFNNRDHRKICSVDGNVAFTGGINLADEYMNLGSKFGHWRDSGLMVKGAAAWSFTAMFLSMWNHLRPTDVDFTPFMPESSALPEGQGDGFVQPFTDTPYDDEPTGANAYLNLIYRARRYVYICTPYLIIDETMMNALCTAAKAGVDVRVMTPGIPDKPLVFELTRSYYSRLIYAGVRVYEYSPGFLHSKTFVSDDDCAICGTINLDYRSLYLHFECAAWMYATRAVLQMRDGYLSTLGQCREITRDWCDKIPWYRQLLQALLRVFAPLM